MMSMNKRKKNHASRPSTVSTVYQVIQAKDRNKKESPVLVNGNAAILNKNYGAAGSGLEIENQTKYGKWDNVQDMWNGKDRHGLKHKTKQGGFKRRTSKNENTPLNNTVTDFAVIERIMKSENRNGYKHHLTHAIEIF